MSNNGKRVAWVTGGGSGIGEAGAEALAADGWTVVVSGRRKEALDAVVAKIAGRPGDSRVPMISTQPRSISALRWGDAPADAAAPLLPPLSPNAALKTPCNSVA